MITKLNRGRNARRVIKKTCPLKPPVERLLYGNLNTWGCYIMPSTQVRCGCEDIYYAIIAWSILIYRAPYHIILHKMKCCNCFITFNIPSFFVYLNPFFVCFFRPIIMFSFFIRLTLDENVHVIVGWGNLNANFVFNLSLILLVFMTIECFLIRNNSKLFPVSTCDNKILNSFTWRNLSNLPSRNVSCALN